MALPEERLSLCRAVVCLPPPFHLRLCFVRLRYVPRSPCKSQRKGQASPEWLAGSKMPDFIYRAVNMSLTAAGFLGLSSVTGHLIMRPLALPDRKHAFCFSRNDASQIPSWILSKCKAFPQLITKLLFRRIDFFFFPTPPLAAF